MFRRFLIAGSLLGLVAAPASAQESTLIIENGRVIVGDGTVLEEASVVVARDRIVAVTAEPVETSSARRIDAAGKTVLPGLIDTHVHVLLDDMCCLPRSAADLEAFIRDRLPERFRAFLTAGITTVMSPGDFWPAIRYIRERVGAGELEGPRIFTAGPIFTAPGGHPAESVCGPWLDREPNPWCREHLAVEVDTREQAREAVEQLALEGVDLIKMVYDTVETPSLPELETELVEEIVSAAHDHGLRAYGHTFGIGNVATAIGHGLDGFVHIPGFYSETKHHDRLVEVMLSAGVPTSTTLVGFDAMREHALRDGREQEASDLERLVRRGQEIVAVLTTTDPGLISLGTDTPWLPPGHAYHREIELVSEAGLTPERVVRAATRNGAAYLGMEDELGTLRPGKLADLILVDGNPLEDLSALQNMELVVKGGEVVVDTRRAEVGRLSCSAGLKGGGQDSGRHVC